LITDLWHQKAKYASARPATLYTVYDMIYDVIYGIWYDRIYDTIWYMVWYGM